MEDLELAFSILERDEKLGRRITAEDLGPLSPSQISRRAKAIKAAHGNVAIAAIYAQVPVLEDLLGIKFHVDHKVPLSKGGEHTAGNLQIVPADVNLLKNDKIDFKYELCHNLCMGSRA